MFARSGISTAIWQDQRSEGRRASLGLQFAGATALDSRVTFTRASTATYVGSNGLLQTAAVNAPRLVYDPVTLAAQGLLVEEQRTNLLLYSEQFDNASWAKGDATILADAILAPDGTTTADKLVENTVNTAHYINQLAGTVGASETRSIYVKSAGRSWFYIAIGAGASAYFDIINGVLGTVTGGTATITSSGNSWFRCTLNATRTTNSNNVTATASANNTVSYTGDGTSGIYIWGAQLEAGAFATSYIPTTTAQATRAADVATMTGTNFSSWYNQTEGTFVAWYAGVSGGRIFMVDDGSTNNRSELRITSNTPTFSSWSSNVQDVSIFAAGSGGLVDGTFAKSATSMKVNDAAISTNGLTPGTDTACAMPLSQTRLFLGSFQGAATFLNGTIKSITYYPRKLSGSELQALTS